MVKKLKGLVGAVKIDQALARGEAADSEGRARITVSLTTEATRLIRRAAFVRGEHAGTGPNVSALIEDLIRQHWDELEREAAGAPGG